MKLVREYIEFERTGDPFKDLDLGIEGKIDMWMTEMGFHPDKYEINDDLTIDVFGDAKLTNANLERLPKYIKFGRIGGGFYAGGNPWQCERPFSRASRFGQREENHYEDHRLRSHRSQDS